MLAVTFGNFHKYKCCSYLEISTNVNVSSYSDISTNINVSSYSEISTNINVSSYFRKWDFKPILEKKKLLSRLRFSPQTGGIPSSLVFRLFPFNGTLSRDFLSLYNFFVFVVKIFDPS